MAEYHSWEQLGGYFDADGTIVIFDTDYMPYKICLALGFVDQSIDQIGMVRNFLQAKGIRVSNILRSSKGTSWSIAISAIDSVGDCLRCMLPFLAKKGAEAQAALDYLDGKITGNELLAIFQEEIDAGNRERRERKVAIHVPWTYPAGDKMLKALRAIRPRDELGRYSNKVTPEDSQAICDAHFKGGKQPRELLKDYPQYGKTTIRRILRRSIAK